MDSLGDRQKMYEEYESGRRLMPRLPAICRLDGRSFSSFTKGLKRPYDICLSQLMQDCTGYLVEETCANIGYTQSDEISLIWYSDDPKSQIFFDGRIQKMTSTLSALASVCFNNKLAIYLPEKIHAGPTFDARVWNVPTLDEAANYLIWRELDATKNSISMAARSQYSHKELMNKHSAEMQEMLFVKGINWNDYPAFFKRGVYVQRRKVTRAFTTDEIEKLPQKHAARVNPSLTVERSEIAILNMPPILRISNRVGIILGEEPKEIAE